MKMVQKKITNIQLKFGEKIMILLRKFMQLEKAIKSIQIDPKLMTADIDVTNNSWPKEEEKSKFD